MRKLTRTLALVSDIETVLEEYGVEKSADLLELDADDIGAFLSSPAPHRRPYSVGTPHTSTM